MDDDKLRDLEELADNWSVDSGELRREINSCVDEIRRLKYEIARLNNVDCIACRKNRITKKKRAARSIHGPVEERILNHHAELLEEFRGVVPSAIRVRETVKCATDIYSVWGDDSFDMITFFVCECDDNWLRSHFWPLPVLLKYASRYDSMRKNKSSFKSSTNKTVNDDLKYQEMLARRAKEAENL